MRKVERSLAHLYRSTYIIEHFVGIQLVEKSDAYTNFLLKINILYHVCYKMKSGLRLRIVIKSLKESILILIVTVRKKRVSDVNSFQKKTI